MDILFSNLDFIDLQIVLPKDRVDEHTFQLASEAWKVQVFIRILSEWTLLISYL